MYTDAMRRAFHSLVAPTGFYVDLIDNEHFLTVRINEESLFKLTHDDKMEALRYVNRVKKALEDNGAIVLVTREAIPK